MEKISRNHAKEQNFIKYFTGKPCKYGHICERYVSGFVCIECLNNRNAQPKFKNNRNNWFATHKNDKKIYDAIYRKENPRNRIGEKQYAATKAKRRAAKLQRTPAWLTPIDFERIKNVYRLAELQTKITGELWHVDHIIPLQGKLVSGLHVPANLQAIRAFENVSKNNKWDPV